MSTAQCTPKIPSNSWASTQILLYLCQYSPDSDEQHTKRKLFMASKRASYRHIHFVLALLVAAPQAERFPIFAFFKIPHHQSSPFQATHHHSHTIPGNPVLGLVDTPNLLVASFLPYHQWLWCCSQECAEISEFRITQYEYSPHLICHHYSQKVPEDNILGLHDAPNLLVTSILRSAHWLGLHKQKRPQFSHFWIPQKGYSPRFICHHYSQPVPEDSVLGLLDALNLLISSLLPYHWWLQRCRQERA